MTEQEKAKKKEQLIKEIYLELIRSKKPAKQ